MVDVLVKNKRYSVSARQAKVLVDIGRGTYMTRDMQAQPVVGSATSEVPAANDAELDSVGQRWNEEIHAADHSKTLSGVWARKRGRKPEQE